MDRVAKLLEVASQDKKEVLATLQKAVTDTLEAYKADNSAAKLRDYQAAAAALEQMCAELESQHFKKPASFANVKEALAFLKAQGYKVEKSKVYADAKRGLLVTQPDRSVLEADVLAYAVRAELDKVVTEKTKIDDAVFAAKATAELELTNIRKEKLLFEHQKEMGLYLTKATVHAEIAMKLGAIEAGFKNLVATSLSDWIEKAHGDVGRVSSVQEVIFDEIDNLMNEFCSFEELQIEIRPEAVVAVEKETERDEF